MIIYTYYVDYIAYIIRLVCAYTVYMYVCLSVYVYWILYVNIPIIGIPIFTFLFPNFGSKLGSQMFHHL